LADRVDARGAGDTGHVNRREGRVDGELLLQIEGLTCELGDHVQTGIRDVGIGSLGKDAYGVGAREQRGLEDVALQERGVDVKGGEGVVAVERIARSSAAVEHQIVGVNADLGGDENCVSGEVDEGDQAGRGVGGRAGGGDRHGKLLRLRCGADGVDRTDDGAVGVAATGDRYQNGCCQSEPGCRLEGLRYGLNGAPIGPRLGVSFCFNSC